MELMASFWLISYQYRALFKHKDGVRGNEPYDAIICVQKHPAQWLADHRKRGIEMEAEEYDPSKGPQRHDDIIRIYSAIELTEPMKPSDLDLILR